MDINLPLHQALLWLLFISGHICRCPALVTVTGSKLFNFSYLMCNIDRSDINIKIPASPTSPMSSCSKKQTPNFGPPIFIKTNLHDCFFRDDRIAPPAKMIIKIIKVTELTIAHRGKLLLAICSNSNPPATERMTSINILNRSVRCFICILGQILVPNL